MRPGLRELIQEYLRIMSEVDLDELLVGLERVINTYKEDMEPYALQLTQQLFDSYTRLTAHTIGMTNSTNADMICSVLSCTNTISKLIRSCKANKDTLSSMENIIYPMLVSTLANEDCFEQGIDCLTLFLYYNSERGVNK